jgi:hypothetical protein
MRYFGPGAIGLGGPIGKRTGGLARQRGRICILAIHWTRRWRTALSSWNYWRALRESNPCFRRERATPTDCGPPTEYRALSIILRSLGPELSNNIIQKRLAFIGDWSGTVVKSGPHERPGILPRRLVRRGGASVVRRNTAINRMEDSDAKICKEAFA